MDTSEKNRSSDCHCINLRRAAKTVTQFYDRMLEESGITLNQYSILSNIHRIEPCSVAELSRKIRLERTTLVRNLKAMYLSNWIYDEAPPGNRKGRIRLTQAGIERIQEAKPLWKKAQNYIEKNLGEEKLKKLTEVLLFLEDISSQN